MIVNYPRSRINLTTKIPHSDKSLFSLIFKKYVCTSFMLSLMNWKMGSNIHMATSSASRGYQLKWKSIKSTSWIYIATWKIKWLFAYKETFEMFLYNCIRFVYWNQRWEVTIKEHGLTQPPKSHIQARVSIHDI